MGRANQGQMLLHGFYTIMYQTWSICTKCCQKSVTDGEQNATMPFFVRTSLRNCMGHTKAEKIKLPNII